MPCSVCPERGPPGDARQSPPPCPSRSIGKSGRPVQRLSGSGGWFEPRRHPFEYAPRPHRHVLNPSPVGGVLSLADIAEAIRKEACGLGPPGRRARTGARPQCRHRARRENGNRSAFGHGSDMPPPVVQLHGLHHETRLVTAARHRFLVHWLSGYPLVFLVMSGPMAVLTDVAEQECQPLSVHSRGRPAATPAGGYREPGCVSPVISSTPKRLLHRLQAGGNASCPAPVSGITGLIRVGHWPMVPGWSSNGTRPRAVPVSSVAASTSPVLSGRFLPASDHFARPST